MTFYSYYLYIIFLYYLCIPHFVVHFEKLFCHGYTTNEFILKYLKRIILERNMELRNICLNVGNIIINEKKEYSITIKNVSNKIVTLNYILKNSETNDIKLVHEHKEIDCNNSIIFRIIIQKSSGIEYIYMEKVYIYINDNNYYSINLKYHFIIPDIFLYYKQLRFEGVELKTCCCKVNRLINTKNVNIKFKIKNITFYNKKLEYYHLKKKKQFFIYPNKGIIKKNSFLDMKIFFEPSNIYTDAKIQIEIFIYNSNFVKNIIIYLSSIKHNMNIDPCDIIIKPLLYNSGHSYQMIKINNLNNYSKYLFIYKLDIYYKYFQSFIYDLLNIHKHIYIEKNHENDFFYTNLLYYLMDIYINKMEYIDNQYYHNQQFYNKDIYDGNLCQTNQNMILCKDKCNENNVIHNGDIKYGNQKENKTKNKISNNINEKQNKKLKRQNDYLNIPNNIKNIQKDNINEATFQQQCEQKKENIISKNNIKDTNALKKKIHILEDIIKKNQTKYNYFHEYLNIIKVKKKKFKDNYIIVSPKYLDHKKIASYLSEYKNNQEFKEKNGIQINFNNIETDNNHNMNSGDIHSNHFNNYIEEYKSIACNNKQYSQQNVNFNNNLLTIDKIFHWCVELNEKENYPLKTKSNFIHYLIHEIDLKNNKKNLGMSNINEHMKNSNKTNNENKTTFGNHQFYYISDILNMNDKRKEKEYLELNTNITINNISKNVPTHIYNEKDTCNIKDTSDDMKNIDNINDTSCVSINKNNNFMEKKKKFINIYKNKIKKKFHIKNVKSKIDNNKHITYINKKENKYENDTMKKKKKKHYEVDSFLSDEKTFFYKYNLKYKYEYLKHFFHFALLNDDEFMNNIKSFLNETILSEKKKNKNDNVIKKKNNMVHLLEIILKKLLLSPNYINGVVFFFKKNEYINSEMFFNIFLNIHIDQNIFIIHLNPIENYEEYININLTGDHVLKEASEMKTKAVKDVVYKDEKEMKKKSESFEVQRIKLFYEKLIKQFQEKIKSKLNEKEKIEKIIESIDLNKGLLIIEKDKGSRDVEDKSVYDKKNESLSNLDTDCHNVNEYKEEKKKI